MGILMADLLTISYPASRFGGDSQEICWQKWELEGNGGRGISAGRFTDCQLFPPADLQETVRKSACRNGVFCQQINWLSVNQPGDLEETVKKSAGRNGRRGISASIFADSQLIFQQIWRHSGNLLAEIEAGGISAGRFVDSQEICWQKWG